jgi:hypothetical protein
MEKEQSQNPVSFEETVKTVKSKIGKKKLTDEDLLVLAAENILHTHTFEEKGYS